MKIILNIFNILMIVVAFWFLSTGGWLTFDTIKQALLLDWPSIGTIFVVILELVTAGVLIGFWLSPETAVLRKLLFICSALNVLVLASAAIYPLDFNIL